MLIKKMNKTIRISTKIFSSERQKTQEVCVHSSSIFLEPFQQTHNHRGDISSGSAKLQREFIGKPAAIHLEQHYQRRWFLTFATNGK